ncbi:MAG: hypothetical protein DDT27_00234 [Dehalococcoidia bacterium]|nr:hypothetical protein [Chloroflexota bacterium]MBT9161697.1 hypothetical protein [Chloroflexota bacterium]MBT9163548.1 hypothetical protein [Chloroflexota bacterium]
MQRRPKKLLDQACTELVEVSERPSGSNTTPSAPKSPQSIDLAQLRQNSVLFGANQLPKIWFLYLGSISQNKRIRKLAF